ncbi:hypothetical protein H6790_00780 [Candidatus Nomurabacteria bacterium]|nr:hypothetical protein [Candidatus Nomurabacteria bacterium]MCB9820468.1 hypothetical protein [Candidatus Nomurabacteria bacterium]
MAKKYSKRLVVLDAHAIIHRAYHALPDFTTSKGIPTGALYGICNMLLKIEGEFRPDYIVAAYDLPGGTFRHETFSDYKAGRGKADDALVNQMERSKDIFKAFSIPIYSHPGFEADDIIGTIAEITKKDKDLQVVIASGDMDTLQLVEGDKTVVYTFKKGINDTVVYDEDAVMERYNFSPVELIDYKGLRGDPSDNIPGIAGVGEKTATMLISHFHTIEEMYKKLKNGEVGDIKLSEKMKEKILEGEKEALFSKELATIRKDAPIEFTLPDQKFRDRLDFEKIDKLFAELEFKSLRTKVKSIFSIEEAINTKPKEILTVDKEEVEKLKLGLWVLDSNRTHIEDDEVLSIAKAKDFKEAEKNIIESINKDELSFVYDDIELPIMPIIKGMQDRGISLDVKFLEKKAKEYRKILEGIERQIYKHSKEEFNINSPKQLGEILYDKLGIKPETGKIKKTAGGARSTRESELQKMKGQHSIIEEILKYRELEKITNTYVEALPKYVAEDGKLRANFNQRGTTTGRFSSDNPNLQNLPIKSEYGKDIRKAFVASPGYKLVSIDYSQIELRVAALLSQDEYFIDVFLQRGDIHHAVAKKVFGVDDAGVTKNMRREAKVINFGILYGMGVNALKENLGSTRSEAAEFHENYFKQFPSIKSYLDSVENFAIRNGYTKTLFGRRRYFPDIRSRIPYIAAQAKRMAINAPIQGTATADIIKLAIKDVNTLINKEKWQDKAYLIMQVHDELVYEVREDITDEFIKKVVPVMEEVIPEEFVKGMKTVPLKVDYVVGTSLDKI